MNSPDDKMKLKTEEEFHLKYKSSRIREINWDGPGWYFIFIYSRLCPRGCCDEYVCCAKSASQWAEDISKEMKELASELREVRRLEKENE